jgi:cytochrome bd-type quinol oxidase subunit 2
MKKNSKLKIVFFGLVLFFCFSLASFANGFNFKEGTGLHSTAEKTGHTEQFFFGEDGSLEMGASQIIAIFLSLIGVVFMVLLVYGGVVWMTAIGNEQKIEQAKKTITRSIIGIAIVLLAYVITVFVVSQFTGQNLLD